LPQSTTTELFNGLREPHNHAAWAELCARYEPVLLMLENLEAMVQLKLNGLPIVLSPSHRGVP